MERSNCSSIHLETEIFVIVTVGIDLAENVFAVHGVDEQGKAVSIRPSVKRSGLLERIAKLANVRFGILCSNFWNSPLSSKAVLVLTDSRGVRPRSAQW